MFKSIKEQLEKYETMYKNTIEYRNQIKAIIDLYKNIDTFGITTLYTHLRDNDAISYQYNECIVNLSKKLGFTQLGAYGGLTNTKAIGNNKIFLENLSIKDFYNYHVMSYVHYKRNPDKYYRPPVCEIGNLSYNTTEANGFYPIKILANMLWLLNHDELPDDETLTKVGNLSRSGDTFIFNTCKITAYKTGRVLVKFSDGAMFKKFKNEFQAACDFMDNAFIKEKEYLDKKNSKQEA